MEFRRRRGSITAIELIERMAADPKVSAGSMRDAEVTLNVMSTWSDGVLHFLDHSELVNHVTGVIGRDAVTVGEVIEWDNPNSLILGNVNREGPCLWPVMADGFGRIWKEEHPYSDASRQQKNRLVCILDPRKLPPGPV